MLKASWQHLGPCPAVPVPVTSVAIVFCIQLPQWPGFDLDGVGEPQISLFDTCCCPRTEFGVKFFSLFLFLSSSPLFSGQRNLSLPKKSFPSHFLFWSRWPFCFQEHLAWNCGPCLCYARISGMHHLSWLHSSFLPKAFSLWKKISVFWGFRFLGR